MKEPASAAVGPFPRAPLRFLYSGIRVRDLDRSLAFYLGLGFRIRNRGAMPHGGLWVHLTRPRSPLRLELNYYPEGNRFRTPYRPGTEMDHLGFYTTDVPGWVRVARRLGGAVVARLREGRMELAYVTDPDGIWLEFFGPKRRSRGKR